jgi:hypothetical protein
VVFLRRTLPETVNVSGNPLCEFSLRLEPQLPKPSRPQPAPLLSFASLQHIRERRSTRPGLCLPATFRPQGLATLSTACSLRTRAGSVSRRRRSWDSPFGAFPSREAFTRFRMNEPTYRFPKRPVFRRTPKTARLAAVPGLRSSRESLTPGHVFSTPDAGCSLGVHSSRAYR